MKMSLLSEEKVNAILVFIFIIQVVRKWSLSKAKMNTNETTTARAIALFCVANFCRYTNSKIL